MFRHTFNEPHAPKRVVVIGAGGFVGAAASKRLEQRGLAVLRITRAQVELDKPDAADKLCGLLRDNDVVIAAAARAPCRNIDMLLENMTMVRALVDAMSRFSLTQVVNISSDAVYGDDPVPLTERSPAAPGSLHGVMHVAREIAFREGLKAPLAILRPTLIYGSDDPHNGYGPNRFHRLAAAGEPIVLFGEGEERRDHVFIDDVAEAIARTVLHRSTGVLNVASGEVHSFREIAEWATTARGRVQSTPRRGPMPHNGYRPFDIAELLTAFPGFRPIGLREGMARYTLH